MRLEAKDVTVRFAGLAALDRVTVTVERGEILGLIGPNGSGKTTLLNVVSGAIRPSAGSIRCGDRAWRSIAPQKAARLGIRRTFQNVRLFEEMTALETVEVPSAVLGERRDRRQQALAALELVGVGACRDRLADTLPHGLQRRLEIARAIAGKPPEFLLLDEPAAGLSPAESAELVDVLLAIRDRCDCGIVLVEHDLRVIMRACSRIVVLNEGTVIAEGDPEAVRNDPAVIKAYLG